MGIENFDIGALPEQGDNSGGEKVSEQAKKKVSEQGQKAQQAHQQVIANQAKNYKFALFLSKVIQRYYNSEKIISFLFSLLKDIEKYEDNIVYIFTPFVLENKKFSSISDFLNFINNGKLSFYKELLWDIVEFEKIGGKSFWYNLKNGKTEISYDDFKKEFLDSIN